LEKKTKKKISTIFLKTNELARASIEYIIPKDLILNLFHQFQTIKAK